MAFSSMNCFQICITAVTAMAALCVVTFPSTAQTIDANCALYSDDTVIEMSECKQTVLKSGDGDGEGGNLTNYQWSNGRVTVTQNVEEFFTINGEDGETVVSRGIYDLCIKNLSDQTIFCTGLQQAAQSSGSHALSLYSKYGAWTEFAWCDVTGHNDYQYCRSELARCERNGDFGSTSCPELGVCSYSSKGKLKSRSACLLHQTVNSKSWHGIFTWENGNRLELDDFHDKTLMNGVRVKTREIINGNCYTTRNRKEEFCFRQNEQYRFSGALADTTKAGGIWITEDTTCTNKLHPFDGSIAVVENSFHEKQPSIYLWYDDIGKAERLGIEADSCQIFDIKKTGSGTFNGKLHCGGEGIEHADNDEIDRSKGSVIIKVKPNEELLLFKHGEKERYVQCQG